MSPGCRGAHARAHTYVSGWTEWPSFTLSGLFCPLPNPSAITADGIAQPELA